MRRGKGGTNSKTQPKSQIQGFSRACHKPLDLTGKEVPLHHHEYILLCQQHKVPCRDSVSCPDIEQQDRTTSTEQKLRERTPVCTGDGRPTACSHSCTSGPPPKLDSAWSLPWCALRSNQEQTSASTRTLPSSSNRTVDLQQAARSTILTHVGSTAHGYLTRPGPPPLNLALFPRDTPSYCSLDPPSASGLEGSEKNCFLQSNYPCTQDGFLKSYLGERLFQNYPTILPHVSSCSQPPVTSPSRALPEGPAVPQDGQSRRLGLPAPQASAPSLKGQRGSIPHPR